MADELAVVNGATAVYIEDSEEALGIRLGYCDAIVADCFLKLGHVQVMRLVIIDYLSQLLLLP